MATKNINASWQFTKDAITVAEGYSVLTQGNWEALDLPHTWNGKDGQDGGNDYHRGTSIQPQEKKLYQRILQISYQFKANAVSR